jgi:hypothetical protein
MVRQLRPGCSIPADFGETRTLASVLRVTTHAAGSDCLNWHGRGPVHLSCAPQPAICPFCDFAPGVAGDVPQRSALCGNVCTELVQHAHAVYTGEFGVACEAQRVRSMQNNSSAVYFSRRATLARRLCGTCNADCRPVLVWRYRRTCIFDTARGTQTPTTLDPCTVQVL